MRYKTSKFKTTDESQAATLTTNGELLLDYAGRFVDKTVQVTIEGGTGTPSIVNTTVNFPVPVVNGDELTASIGGEADQTMTIACTSATKTAVNMPTYNIPN